MKPIRYPFIILGLLICVGAQSRDSKYVPLSEFGKDTLTYLRTNFQTNSSYYIGKTIGELLEDNEVAIKSARICYNNTNETHRITLYVDEYLKERHIYRDRFGVRNGGKKLPCIRIEFTPPIDMSRCDDYFNVDYQTEKEWNLYGKRIFMNKRIAKIKVCYIAWLFPYEYNTGPM